MLNFNKIPENTFEVMPYGAGMMVKSFDPSNPADIADENIICATTGGIKIDCIPSFVDMGEDVDNCPKNMKELKKLTGWECKFAFTSLDASLEMLRRALGAADIDSASSKVSIRASVDGTDFSDVWWVGNKADGGMLAVCLKNALSTGGFSMQTADDGKGQISCELTGHVSIKAQDDMPMEFYSADAAEGDAA